MVGGCTGIFCRWNAKHLKSHDDIVIKEADKGLGVVIMDKERCINEAFRQLGDRTVYRETASDPTQEISKLVNDRIRQTSNGRFISGKTLEYLLINSKPRVGRFYLLPKIHKRGCPGRPVISGCGTCTERISEFVDATLSIWSQKYHLTLKIPNTFYKC